MRGVDPPVVRWLAVVAAALVLQGALAPFIGIRGAVPSAVGIGVGLFALRARLPTALAFGLLAGALEDALSAGTGAAWTIATTLTAGAMVALARWAFVEGIVLSSLAAGLAVLVRDTLFWIGMKMEGYPSGLGGEHVYATLWSGLESAVVALLVLAIGARTER